MKSNFMIPMIAFLMMALAFNVSAVPIAPSSSNTTAYYPMNESSGNLISLTGSNDLTEIGTVGSQTGIITGARGNYNVSDYFNGLAGTMVNQSQNFSYSFWVYPTASGTTAEQIISAGSKSSGGYGYTIDLKSSGIDIFVTNTGSGSILDLQTSNIFATNQWNYVTLTHDGSTRNDTLYVNGTYMNSGIETAFSGTGSTNLSIGVNDINHATPIFPLTDAYLDEMGVFNYTLNSSETSYLYNSGSPSIAQQYPFTTPLLNVTLNTPANNSIIHSDHTTLNATAIITSGQLKNATFFTNESGTWASYHTTTSVFNNTPETYDFYANNGYYIWNVQFCSKTNECSWATNNQTFTIEDVPFIINLNSPKNNTNITTTNTPTLNATVIYDDVNNLTFYTNITGTWNATKVFYYNHTSNFTETYTVPALNNGTYLWGVYGCNTFKCNWSASNYTFNVYYNAPPGLLNLNLSSTATIFLLILVFALGVFAFLTGHPDYTGYIFLVMGLMLVVNNSLIFGLVFVGIGTAFIFAVDQRGGR